MVYRIPFIDPSLVLTVLKQLVISHTYMVWYVHRRYVFPKMGTEVQQEENQIVVTTSIEMNRNVNRLRCNIFRNINQINSSGFY